jgi:hypothetical protein
MGGNVLCCVRRAWSAVRLTKIKELRMLKFRKKPVEIEAMRLDASPASLVAIGEWAKEYDVGIIAEHDGQESHRVLIPTLEGTMAANVGDWVIKGIKNEFYPCKDEIFQATYDPVA